MARKPLTISVGPGSTTSAQDATGLPMSPTFAQRVSQAKAKRDAGQAEDMTASPRDAWQNSSSVHLASTQPPPDTLPRSTTDSFLLSPSPTAKAHLDDLPSIHTAPRSQSASRPREAEATIRQIYEPHPGRRVDEMEPHPGRRVDEAEPHPGRRVDEVEPHPGRRIDETDSSLRSHSEGRSASPDVTSLKCQNPEVVVVQASPSSESPLPSGQRPTAPFSLLGPNQRDGAARRNRLRPRTPFVNFLNRTRSVRTDTGEMTPRTTGHITPSTTGHMTPSEMQHGLPHHQIEDPSLKTAPLQEGDRSFREMMASTMRNRSADRQQSTGSENGSTASGRDQHKQHGAFSSSLKENTGSMFSSLKNSSSKAADGLGKAGKGFFGKLGRSGSSGEKEQPTYDGNYVCSVITLPLVEQTRLTRISKRLEDSRDKTEFWMPALPWRCIDYLNYKGCEEEGLYRVPGSKYKIEQWQRRFDMELDINLFDEPDLYDINIIGSMFKAWLRDLPDVLLPKDTQIRIENECKGANEVPQMLKDELSKLPPYNYYLLFAITCHLSLLHTYVGQNKMDYRNLCICFQPCLKMEPFCFYFLVCEWKHCWQGCWTEKEALAAEYRFLEGEQAAPSSAGNNSSITSRELMIDERAVSSSESSKPPSFRHAAAPPPAPVEVDFAPKAPRPGPIPRGVENLKKPPMPIVVTARTDDNDDDQLAATGGTDVLDEDEETPTQPQHQEVQSLSPLVPLSPLHI